MATRVIHIRDSQGTPDEVDISRNSKWGNPYSHDHNTRAFWFTETRDMAISEYGKWLINQEDLMKDLPTLKNKVLVCYCKPKSCHGDVLAMLADLT